MADLISRASGNFTTASTWKSVGTGTRAKQATHSASTNTTTSDVYNADAQDITIANLLVVEGIMLFCEQASTTGTVTVTLSADSGTTATRTVTVNASDLPVEPSWVFFEFGSTLTADGGTDYAIGIKGSSAGNATFYRDGTTANWTHFIGLDSNPGSVAAGDVFYVVGELTGAGTGNDFTVTMDSTATTDYGTGTAGTESNGIDIGDGGTLSFGTSAATNYILKLSGSVAIWGDGILQIGTTGTPIPRGSTALLHFDCGANVDFGLTVNNGGTFISQGLSRTSGKDIYYCKLNTDEAAAQTTLGVDTDTGWLSGDVIGIASTTRTSSQYEQRTLNANANASDMTVTSGLTNAHSGTSPTQAEVLLLTRNVTVRGQSASLQAFVDLKATSVTVDCDWTAFTWLGSGTALKRGITIATVSGSVSFQYCSFYDFIVSSSNILNISAASGTVLTFSNNVTYNCQSNHIVIVATSGSMTFDSNFFVGMVAGGPSVSLSDVGVVFTNNTVSSGGGVSLAQNAVIGTFTGNTIHSTSAIGLSIQSSDGISGTIGNLTVWRCNSDGVSVSINCRGLIFDTATLFGNVSSNLNFTWGQGRMVFNSVTSNGDTTFSTTSGVAFQQVPNAAEWNFYSCDFSTVTGIKTAHTNDFNISQEMFARMFLNNCKLGAATEVASQSNLFSDRSLIASQKHDQTAGLHKMWKRYGTITIETTTTQAGGQSMKLTPNNASNKLQTEGFQVPVANGQTCTPQIYVYEDASYNGARARLIVKRNDALGITSDTVLDTATASSDEAWEALTGTTAAVTDDGVLEFIVDADGTAGNLFVDTFTATVA